MKRSYLLSALAVIGIIGLACFPVTRHIAFALVVGWIQYLTQTLPSVTIRWDGVMIFFVGIVLFLILLHRLLAWVSHEVRETGSHWRWRSSLLIVGAIVTVFVAGTAMVGVVHQTVWVTNDPKPLLVPDTTYVGTMTKNRLKQLSLALSNCFDIYGSDVLETEHHSWVTWAIPCLSYYSEGMHRDKPWNHPDNHAETKKLVPPLLNPNLDPFVAYDEAGYGVSHYEMNRLLFDDQGRRLKDNFKAGSSNTLVLGDVAENFQPWAKPDTHRDPTLGINKSPDGFGGPKGYGGALFLMRDGSLRNLSKNIDPEVLRSLATPGTSSGT